MMSADNFSMPDRVPAFVDEIVAGASMEVIDSCGGNERCIFDASQTGNLDISLTTMEIDEMNEENEMLASKMIMIIIVLLLASHVDDSGSPLY